MTTCVNGNRIWYRSEQSSGVDMVDIQLYSLGVNDNVAMCRDAASPSGAVKHRSAVVPTWAGKAVGRLHLHGLADERRACCTRL